MDTATTNQGNFVTPERPQASGQQAPVSSDAIAPLLFNAWYAIAQSSDVGEALGSIKVLNEPLVYFRASDGSPVVLDDRCIHRRYALSKSKRIGDTIQCGYHGFTYARSGQCMWAPGLPTGDGRAKWLKFGVRSYPCAERGPWLWVWMGDPTLANPDDIPMPELANHPESTVYGYKLNPCNYMMIIENLLDLSHLHFVHDSADLASVAIVPEDAPPPHNGVAWRKVIEQTEMSLAAHLCGGDPKRLIRQVDETAQYGPALTFGTQRREALPGDNEPVTAALMQIAHATTPQDEHSTHQFFASVMSDPYVIEAAEVKRILQDVVFEQDVEILDVVQDNVTNDRRSGRVEFNMMYDRFGLKMRDIIKNMKSVETGDN